MTAATPQQPGRDLDSQDTRDWMDALSAVIEKEGGERAHFLLEQLLEHAIVHILRHRRQIENFLSAN
jgi:pyruvate dehydrogenase E1 component